MSMNMAGSTASTDHYN